MIERGYATQLLNAGGKVTSIQKLLGHQRLNSTMTYARVHDRTVAEDCYRAMAKMEEPATQGETDRLHLNVQRVLGLLATIAAEALTTHQLQALEALRADIQAACFMDTLQGTPCTADTPKEEGVRSDPSQRS